MTQQSPSQRTSERSPSEALFLLSGEQTSISSSEAVALAEMQDPDARVERPEERVLLVSGRIDPDEIAKRVAFSRRVGVLVPGGMLDPDQLKTLRSDRYRISIFDLKARADSDELIAKMADQVRGRVSLDDPTYEITVVRGERDYVALSRPSLMRQDWVTRRPRKRAFFHPSAIFPKLSRALVNLSRVEPGEVFLDPFCGTGSLLIEADEVGALPVGSDIAERMVRGALRNMRGFSQDWAGLVRSDSTRSPFRTVDAIATDVPYGRVSSTVGSDTRHIMDSLVVNSASMLQTGRRLVLMHPRHVPIESGSDFQLEEEHHLYIHRKLTRTISVLRRV